MAVPSARLQQLLVEKDTEKSILWCDAFQYGEGWAIVDGCLVVYDHYDTPAWLQPLLDAETAKDDQ